MISVLLRNGVRNIFWVGGAFMLWDKSVMRHIAIAVKGSVSHCMGIFAQKDGIYRDISRFSEPKEAAIDKVGLALTGCWWKCYNAGFEGEKSTDISEFPSPSVKTEQHFYQRSVKVGGGYGKIQSVTVCGKQENMNRFTLVERILVALRGELYCYEYLSIACAIITHIHYP